MDTTRIARSAQPFTLVRVNLDGTEEQVSEHTSFKEAWSAGTHAVTVEDKHGAYLLYANGRCVARFGHSRLQPRRTAKSFDWSVIG